MGSNSRWQQWVFFLISWIAYGHATNSFRFNFSLIPHLQNTFRRLNIFLVDVLYRQNINGCTTINMELNVLFIDKHLCLNFEFRDAVDSACHLWLWGQPIKEFFLAGAFSFALHWDAKWFFFPLVPQTRPQAAQFALPLRCFLPQKSHGLPLVDIFSSLCFRFGLSRLVCFGFLRSDFFIFVVFTLWASWGSGVVWSIFFSCVFETSSLFTISMHFCNVTLPWRNRRLRVPPSRRPRTIRSRISVSCRHVQKLHDCASVLSSPTYVSMESPSFWSRLLNT